jgi:hypothetical protein
LAGAGADGWVRISYDNSVPVGNAEITHAWALSAEGSATHSGDSAMSHTWSLSATGSNGEAPAPVLVPLRSTQGGRNRFTQGRRHTR